MLESNANCNDELPSFLLYECGMRIHSRCLGDLHELQSHYFWIGDSHTYATPFLAGSCYPLKEAYHGLLDRANSLAYFAPTVNCRHSKKPSILDVHKSIWVL